MERLRRDVERTRPSSTEVQNERSSTIAPHFFHGIWIYICRESTTGQTAEPIAVDRKSREQYLPMDGRSYLSFQDNEEICYVRYTKCNGGVNISHETTTMV